MDGSVGFMVDGWMVLGVVVCPIVTAFIPVVAELLLRMETKYNSVSMQEFPEISEEPMGGKSTKGDKRL
jgi:hypothetical protein